MTIAFSALSLKRNRSSSTNMKTKESKLNAIFNKIASPFIQSNENDNTHKKRRQQQQHNRRSSLSLFIDYFRTEDDHPFANDALFEQNRYHQQKKEQRQQSCIYPPNTTSSILLKSPNNKNTTQHRHTNSSPIIYSKKKKSNHIRHYSHVSCISASNITVKSEDLTAKEFADMAGIRILSEDELDQDSSFIDMNSYTTQSKKICTHCGDEEENDIIMVPSLLNVSRTCHSSIINSSLICPPEEEDDDEPQIWDNQFWKKPGQHEQEQQQPIMPTLKKDTIIKKGRFEIHISSSGTTSPSTSLPIKKSTEVIEWKRKSRPTNTLKHQLTAV